MAEQSNALSAIFPTPPPFWQSFTPDNVERIATLRREQQPDASQDGASKAPPRLLDLPPELRHLQPPAPPADGKYRLFGGNYNLNEELPSLSEQNIPQLYNPSVPRAVTLKKMAKLLLRNFHELLRILAINPDLYEAKIEDIRTLFINFHHLLNEYRPHQARESLILMMEEQLEQSRAETEGIRKMKEKVEGVLEGLGQAKLVEEDVRGEEEVKDPQVVKEREVWEALDAEFA